MFNFKCLILNSKLKTQIFLILISCILLLSAMPVPAREFTFQWQYTEDSEITGFKLYQRIKSQGYDYEQEIATVPAGTHEVTVDVTAPYIFAVRAYAEGDLCTAAGCTTCPCDSKDSNEVTNGQFTDVCMGSGTGFE